MRASKALFAMVLGGQLPPRCSGFRRHQPSFVNHLLPSDRRSFERNQILGPEQDNEAILEAEEAAAVDAHDVSDPGIEGAAMERAVIMAAEEFKDLPHKHKDVEDDHKTTWMGRIRSLFHNRDGAASEEELAEVRDAEAKFARRLSDVAATEHANRVMLEDTKDKAKSEEDAMLEAEATYAKSLSNAAAVEHAKMVSSPRKEDKGRVKAAVNAEANYAQSLSNVAAIEHAKMEAGDDDIEAGAVPFSRKDDEDRIASIEKHYESIDKDIKAIEHLIEEADKADKSEVRVKPTLSKSFHS